MRSWAVETDDGEVRRYALWAAAACVVSRLAALLVGGWAANSLTYYDRALFMRSGRLYALFLHPWTNWDGSWFVDIARRGYIRPASEAFFPLYPLVIHLVGGVWHNYRAVGILLSLIFYAAAMVVLFRLVLAEHGARVAAMTIALVSFFPTALVFNAAYSESLFLLLTVGCLALARRGRWLLAGLAGLLATLTRSSGLVLVVPMLLMYVQQRGWSWRHLALGWKDLRLTSLVLVPAGLFVYMAYLKIEFGNALLFSHAEKEHWRRAFAWPWVDVGRAYHAMVATIRLIALHPTVYSGYQPGAYYQNRINIDIMPLVILVMAVAALALGWRYLSPAYRAYSAAGLAFPLFFPSGLYPMFSYPRFAMMVFPLFIAAAAALRRHPVLFWGLLVVSGAVMLWLAGAFAIRAHAV